MSVTGVGHAADNRELEDRLAVHIGPVSVIVTLPEAEEVVDQLIDALAEAAQLIVGPDEPPDHVADTGKVDSTGDDSDGLSTTEVTTTAGCSVSWCEGSSGDCQRGDHYGPLEGITLLTATLPCPAKGCPDCGYGPFIAQAAVKLRPGQVIAQVSLHLYGAHIDSDIDLLPGEARALARILTQAADHADTAR